MHRLQGARGYVSMARVAAWRQTTRREMEGLFDRLSILAQENC